MTVWSRASRPLRSLPLAVLLAIVSGLKNISIKIRRSLVGESLDFSIAIEILSALRKTPIPATSSTSFTSPYKRCIYMYMSRLMELDWILNIYCLLWEFHASCEADIRQLLSCSLLVFCSFNYWVLLYLMRISLWLTLLYMFMYLCKCSCVCVMTIMLKGEPQQLEHW